METIVNKLKLKQLLPLLALGGMLSCDNDISYWWEDVKDSQAPGPVSNVNVENRNGSALLTYTLPDDPDLMGVKACFSLNSEYQNLEVYASAQTDTLILDGFGDTEAHSVVLYAVDESGNVSTGVTATVQPLQPLVIDIGASIDAMGGFGCIYVTWENPENRDVAVEVFIKDSLDNWQLHNTYFSNRDSVRWRVQVAEQNKEIDYRVQVRDRFMNYAEAKEYSLTALEENEILPKENGVDIWYAPADYEDKWLKWTGDLRHTNNSPSHLFKNLYSGTTANSETHYYQGTAFYRYYFPEEPTNQNNPILPPNHEYLTVDMGREAYYSRLKCWLRNRSPLGSSPLWSELEVWGSNNPRSLDEFPDQMTSLRYWTDWGVIPVNGGANPYAINGTEDWIKDGTWERIGTDWRYVLPSGITRAYGWGSALPADDQAFLNAGVEWEFDISAQSKSFRWLRFRISDTANYPNDRRVEIGEMKIYGRLK
jgi:hypothetical protein